MVRKRIDCYGREYFIFGKTRIKVYEHFAENGKILEELLCDVIKYTQGHPLIHALQAGALHAARYDTKYFLESFFVSSNQNPD